MVILELIVLMGIVAVLLLQVLTWRKLNGEEAGKNSDVLASEFEKARAESGHSSRQLREEVAKSIGDSSGKLTKTLVDMGARQSKELLEIRKDIQNRFDKMGEGVGKQLKELREGNEKKLDQMRETVDEKLQKTLEKRLGESFKQVSERLEQVHKGLGEMKGLADGVGDLQRVLTNVKARGTWGEVQLGAILEQILTPNQFERNVKTKVGSNGLVEYAIKLPGASNDPAEPMYLPIDSKFPQEDYLRLRDASVKGDAEGVEQSAKALMKGIKSSAKEISEKYIDPPNTTDFAIMFLPTEGLYAEVLRQPGLMEDLQARLKVVITGPTTLSATVNSLKLGFRTLAIEKRSAEVWNVLNAVKTEFGKFGGALEKVKKQLATASRTIESTQVRTRAMARQLKTAEELPAEEAAALLGLDEDIDDDSAEIDGES